MTEQDAATGHGEDAALRRICLIGGARYTRPMDPTVAKKFETLAPLGRFWVIGFTDSVWPTRWTERGVAFYLLPGRVWPVARYLALFLAGSLLCGWCVFFRDVRILVAQSPYEAVPAAWVKGLARLLGRRVVLIVESHGDFEASLFLQRTVRFGSVYRRAMRAAATYGAQSADLLRAVSAATGRQLRSWAGGQPLVTFHTWSDLDVFFAAGRARRPGWNIVYAGVLTPLKGVDLLIDSFATVAPPAQLLIIGRATDHVYAAALHRRVADAGLTARAQFIGHLLQRDLARRLTEARVLALPSRSEGLPRVILEAMAAGVPVVATAVAGTPEVIEDGVTGWLVPVGDAAALAARLRWIIAHPDEAEAVGAKGRALAMRRFSNATYRHGYAELFTRADEILGTPHRGVAAAMQPRDGRG